MKIQTVKEQLIDGVLVGYKVNDNSFFPAENCELVKQWISEGNTPEPEFTEEELQITSINKQIQEAKTYLADTGWIWEKYNRNVLVLKDMTNEEFNLKYSEVIFKQEEYRALINELEVQLEVTNG